MSQHDGPGAERPGGGGRRRGLILDRDGIVNVDRGFVHQTDQFEFVPGIFALARFWTQTVRGPIAVVTNQSGIGRGYFDERTYHELTRWMCARFEAEGARIAAVYHCPFHPTHGVGPYRRDHPWRKPHPGMILQAVGDLGLDPARSVLVGDRMSDIAAGAAAGVGLSVLAGSHEAGDAGTASAYERVPDLAAALALIRGWIG